MRHPSRTGLALLTALALGLGAGCSSRSDGGLPAAETAGGSTAGNSSSPSPSPSSPSPSSPGPSSSRAAGAAGDSFTVAATGDVLLHPPLWAQAERDAARTGAGAMDFTPVLAGVEPYIADADLALCHLETPLAPKAGPFSGYPSFSGPPQITAALKQVGYDACSTASNHTFDQGAAGIKRTLSSLDAVGLAHTGSARTRAESRQVTILTANGVKVGFLSYSYGWNGNSYPGNQTWRGNVIDKARILADARRARAAGAEAVILALHWGTEYQQTPSAQQLALAPQLARSGLIDLIVSHHAHVVEPVQRIGRTWVTYGLGNLLADHSTPGPANAEGLLARFTFTRGQDDRFTATEAEYVPLMMTKTAPLRLLDVRQALKTGKYGSSTRARLQSALKRTTTVVQSRGAAKAGLHPAPLP